MRHGEDELAKEIPLGVLRFNWRLFYLYTLHRKGINRKLLKKTIAMGPLGQECPRSISR